MKKDKCENCNNSLGKLKRRFCSSDCKKKFVREANLLCENCGIGYYKPACLKSQSRFCSRKCQNRSQARNNTLEKEARICESCSAAFVCAKNSKRRFCGKSCSGMAQRIKRVECVCEICEKKYSRIETYKTRFCSRDCQYEAQSKGIIKTPSAGRAGYRTDLSDGNYYKSSLEADFARFCKFINLEYLYEEKTFKISDSDGKTRRYTPDFFLPDLNLYVELKGIRKDRKYEKNVTCLEHLKSKKVPITLIEMKVFYYFLKSENLFSKIENLEHRSYKRTKGLATRAC